MAASVKQMGRKRGKKPGRIDSVLDEDIAKILKGFEREIVKTWVKGRAAAYGSKPDLGLLFEDGMEIAVSLFVRDLLLGKVILPGVEVL